MGIVCIYLKKRGISVGLLTEEELDEIYENDLVSKKIDLITSKYIETVCFEIDKLNLGERQAIMAEILAINKLQNAMEDALGKMYDKGLLKRVENKDGKKEK
jgi:uncharacterized protein YqgQ